MQPTRYGPWLLLDRLAVGGMAEVFVAVRDGEPPGRLFSLKRLLPALARDEEQVRLFLDEARLAAQLRHPALPAVRELGREGDGYHIAFDYVPGQDLRAVAERARSLGAPLTPGVAAAVARAVADALDHAHRARGAGGAPLHVVHRDVSPGNVLVGYDGVIRLIDFGIAQAAHRREPGEGGARACAPPEDDRALRGKLAYMSPEMVRGLPVDRRSDVFALGVVLHELLTGERLFSGRSELSTLERVRSADVPPPSSRRAGIPPALDAVVLKALARDPADRHAWASELRDALEPFASPDAEPKLAAFLARAFAEELRRERARLEALLGAGGRP